MRAFVARNDRHPVDDDRSLLQDGEHWRIEQARHAWVKTRDPYQARGWMTGEEEEEEKEEEVVVVVVVVWWWWCWWWWWRWL